MNLSPQSVVAVTKHQVSCELGDESAILNTRHGIYYGLDPIGTEIWKRLQNPCKISEIQQFLLEEYDVEPERCQCDLLDLLKELLAAGLIEIR